MRGAMRMCAWAGAAAVPLVLALGGCSDLLTSPAADAGSTIFSFTLVPSAAAAGNSSDAFGKTDAAHVRVTRSGASTLDSVVAVSGAGDRMIPLSVRLPDAKGAFDLAVDLTSHGQALFRGTASVELSRGHRTEVVVPLQPVIAGLAVPDSLPTMTALGDTLRARAAVVFASGDTVTGADPSWTGDQGTVVSTDASGLVHSLKEGLATLTATYQGFSATTRVRVQAIVQRVVFTGTGTGTGMSADTGSLPVGGTLNLSAQPHDRNGNVLQRTISWQSSAPSIASVDVTGKVIALRPGVAVITATSETKIATFTLTVLQVPVASVLVVTGGGNVLRGDTVTLSATPRDANGNPLTDRSCTWSSSDPGVLALIGQGNLVQRAVALALGSSTIRATCEGKVGEVTVSVVQPLIGVNPSELKVSVPYGSNPGPQTLSVFNAGGGTLSGLSVAVSYPVDYPGGWLTATLNSTTAPTTITLQINTLGSASSGAGVAGGTAGPLALTAPLYPGTFYATVTVSSTIPGTTPVDVLVTLTVYDTEGGSAGGTPSGGTGGGTSGGTGGGTSGGTGGGGGTPGGGTGGGTSGGSGGGSGGGGSSGGPGGLPGGHTGGHGGDDDGGHGGLPGGHTGGHGGDDDGGHGGLPGHGDGGPGWGGSSGPDTHHDGDDSYRGGSWGAPTQPWQKSGSKSSDHDEPEQGH